MKLNNCDKKKKLVAIFLFSFMKGLFNYDHMEYEYDRAQGVGDEPSLTEMVEFAIRSLQNNEKGFVLLVECKYIVVYYGPQLFLKLV